MALTAQQQIFVRELVAQPNLSQYKAAIKAGCSIGNASSQSSKWLADPRIRRELLDEVERRAAKLDIGPLDVVRMWAEIATADPNELVHQRVSCCRYCWGANFKFQWKNEGEWAEAVEQALQGHEIACAEAGRRAQLAPELKLPDVGGGFDFKPRLAPNDDCPKCDGDGVSETIVADTRFLKGPAKRLYAGVKRTKEGIEVLMHSQDKAREMLARHFGMLNDKLQLSMPGGVLLYTVDDLKNLSAEDLEYVERLAEKIEANRQLPAPAV